MLKSLLSAIFACFVLISFAQKTKSGETVVTIKTSYGDMVAILYDETPKHKANFIKLITEKFYDSLLFHRVISEFMIQGGDPASKKATAGQPLGSGGPGYNVDAEIVSKFYHERGALSAARLPDNMNPTKASSGSQFYVVQGKKYSVEELDQMEAATRNNRKGMALRDIFMSGKYPDLLTTIREHERAQDMTWLNTFFETSDTLIVKEKPEYKSFSFTPEQKTLYTTVGGAPHLDGDYTVFGKVIKGFDVIDKIAAVEKNRERPVEDIRMFVTVQQLSRKKIEKDYGYIFPTEVKK